MAEMAEHRVPVLSGSLRRYEDPERSADPRIRQVVAELRTLEPAPAPRAHFRAELRAQLVAVAPRLVAEGTHAEAPGTRAAAHPDATARSLTDRLAAVFGRMRGLPLGRPIAMVTAVIAIFALLLGGAVWVSKKALPGDTLYALKRANENVQLSLTSGDTARGKEYLSFASTRADEATELLKRSSALAAGPGSTAAAGINAHTQKLVAGALNSADDDTRNASKLLGGEAVRNGSTAPLTAISSWAPGQLTTLQAVVDRIPAGALHDRAASSVQLVRAATARAQALDALSGCSCLGSAASDALGPVPCPVCELQQSPAPTPPPGTASPGTTTKPGGTPKSSTKAGSGSTTHGTNGGGQPSPAPTSSSSGGGGTTGGGILPTGPLPPITIHVPTLLPQPTSSTGSASTSPTCVIDVILHLLCS
jgi:hypothetical protein